MGFSEVFHLKGRGRGNNAEAGDVSKRWYSPPLCLPKELIKTYGFGSVIMPQFAFLLAGRMQ